MLQARAEEHPRREAYSFLSNGEEVSDSLTYAELGLKARSIAALLVDRGLTGKRVLLMHPTGLDFVAALFGCFYAGVTAVPVVPEESGYRWRTDRLRRLLSDCDPAALMVASGDNAGRDDDGTGLPPLLYSGETAAVNGFEPVAVDPGFPAILQYTSGSTSLPRGVMVTHRNVIGNVVMLERMFGQPEGATTVGWLPLHHDLGLFGNVLRSAYSGGRCVLMSPMSFIRRPVRWLQAISRFGAFTSGGPNFSFDLCADKVSEEQARQLDLSCWGTAFNGAEPVRAATIERFSRAFGSSGFSRRSFSPGYGLAEATLLVSGTGHDQEPLVLQVSAAALRKGRVAPAEPGAEATASLVSCGPPCEGLRTEIVDPETRRPLGTGEIGEIWVNGETVAAGYWNHPGESAYTFAAVLNEQTAGGDRAGWLRTGDLGTHVDGELVVTGRLKDLIVVRGANHYPQDIESIGPDRFRALRAGCAAAFPIEEGGTEKIVVVHEYRPDPAVDPAQVVEHIRRKVAAEHGLFIDRVVLTAYGQVPKTSSGKLQRSLCRERLAAGTLKILHDDQVGSVGSDEEAGTQEVTDQLRRLVAGLLNRPVGKDELRTALSSMGLDSLRGIELQELIQGHFGVEVDLSDLLGSWSVADLGRHIHGARQAEAADGPGKAPASGSPGEASASAGAGEVPAPGGGKDEPAAGESDMFPLTDLQQAYLVGRSDEYELGGIGSQIYLEYRHHGLDTGQLAENWLKVVRRHEMLRAVVTPEGKQHVRLSPQDCALVVEDLSTRPDAEEQVQATRERMSRQVHDPETGPLFELRACRLPGDETVVHISFDLLMADARSLMLALKEWGAFYLGRGPAEAVSSPSFRDFVARRARRSATAADQALRSRAIGLPPGPAIPLATDPSSLGRPVFRRRATHLDAPAWRRLQDQAKARGVTPAALVGAAFSEILALYSEGRAFSLTVTSFDRPSTEVGTGVIGEFTDLLLVTVPATGGVFEERVHGFSRALLASLDKRWANGLALLRERSQLVGATTRPLAPVVFTSLLDEDAGGLSWLGKEAYATSRTPQVWLDHQAMLEGDRVKITWDAVDELFPPGLLDDMFGAYLRLLAQLAERESWWLPGRTLAGLAGLEAVETPVPDRPAGGMLLHGLVLEQAERTPDAVAVIAGARRVTYAELVAAARSLAGRLGDAGIGRGDLVAVSVLKSLHQVVTVLGVLLAGAGYLPLDPAAPARRRTEMIEESGAAALVVAGPYDVSVGAIPLFDAEAVLDGSAAAPAGRPVPAADPGDVAYVIYTSGSTGRPKGVAIEHRSAVNTVTDINSRFGVNARDRVLAVTPLTFDLSVYDLFGPLAAGGAVVVPDNADRHDPRHWRQLIHDEEVTVWNSVPSLLRLLWEQDTEPGAWGKSLRLALLSGDWIPVPLASAVRTDMPDVRLVSLGGATEAAIWSVLHEIKEVRPGWRSIPYGRAMRGQGAHVLDGHLEPRPIWVPGPLFLSGEGLARGYWRDGERTAASFVTTSDGRRLYRTGDIARLLPDGNLELLGREDEQVKIQGHRIEPGEVESALNRHPAVIGSVAGAIGPRDGVRRLAAYVRLTKDAATTVEELREHMAGTVPRYLVPDMIRTVPDFPLTENGKVDRAALFSAPVDDVPPATGAAAVTTGGCGAVERTVLDIVASALLDVSNEEYSDFGTDTSFAELALTSMHIQVLMARLEKEFAFRPTIAQLHVMKNLGELVTYYAEHS
ncbi:amino acid adenylation domain-containing protein [Streptomyces sp. NPDC060027]|uniref:amino acid adenylation domain-containing protein n=1 Tax=Streptomyces sp. NPDC060027 TaxID=3347040 RepID=UPI00369B6231